MGRMAISTTDTGSELHHTPEEGLAHYGLNTDTHDIITPGAREIFIDIDNERDMNLMEARIETLLKNGIQVEVTRQTPSKTPGHWHVVLEFDRDLTPTERLVLQACLGSDRKRELLSLLRIWLVPEAPPTVFFEPKETAIG
jgi:hypothetical protein